MRQRRLRTTGLDTKLPDDKIIPRTRSIVSRHFDFPRHVGCGALFYSCVLTRCRMFFSYVNFSVLALSALFCSGLLTWTAMFIIVKHCTTTSKESACRVYACCVNKLC